MIKMRKDLVLGFFKNASHMLGTYGEVHPPLLQEGHKGACYAKLSSINWMC